MVWGCGGEEGKGGRRKRMSGGLEGKGEWVHIDASEVWYMQSLWRQVKEPTSRPVLYSHCRYFGCFRKYKKMLDIG